MSELPFTKQQMFGFMAELEDANLFLMKLNEDDEKQVKDFDQRALVKEIRLKDQIQQLESSIAYYDEKRQTHHKVLKRTEKNHKTTSQQS